MRPLRAGPNSEFCGPGPAKVVQRRPLAPLLYSNLAGNAIKLE